MKYVPLVRKTLTKFRPLFLARTNWNKILPRESSVRMMLLPMQSLYVQNFKIRDGFSFKIPVFLKVIFEVQKLALVVLEISLNDMSRVAHKSSKFSVSTQLYFKWHLLIYHAYIFLRDVMNKTAYYIWISKRVCKKEKIQALLLFNIKTNPISSAVG